MKHITHDHMLGVVDELRKLAWSPGNAVSWLAQRPWLGGLSGQYGKQLALGAGLGATTGAFMDSENPLRGAFRGGLTGGALTGAGQLMTRGGRESAKRMFGNLGKRTKYHLTGADKPSVEEARNIGLLGKAPAADASKGEQLRDAANVLAHERGWSSLPGAIKGAIDEPGELLRNSWNRMDWMGKGFTGLGAYQAGKEALTPTQEGGPGRAERVAKSLGSLAGFTVAPSGILPAMMLGTGAGEVAGAVGKGVDWAGQGVGSLLRRKASQPVPNPTDMTGV